MDYKGRLLPGLPCGLYRGRTGGGGGGLPYLYRKLRPEGPKKNLETAPPLPYLRLWMAGFPPYLKYTGRKCIIHNTMVTMEYAHVI